MAWESHKGVLDRDGAVVVAHPFIEVAEPVLREFINYSTNVLVRCQASSLGGIDEDIAPMTLYHHLIEMADGVAILAVHSAAVAALPLVRSMFEAWVSLEWLLADANSYRERSLSWYVGSVRRDLATNEQLDRRTGRGKALRADMARDRFVKRVPRPPRDQVRRMTGRLRAVLELSHLKDVADEFDRLRVKGGREPEWFSTFGGPASLEQLSRKLDVAGIYAVLYRHMASVAHASDGSRFVRKGPDGKPVLGHIRSPEELPGVVTNMVSFLFEGTRLMLGRFRSGEEQAFGAWYVENVRPGFRRLMRFRFEPQA